MKQIISSFTNPQRENKIGRSFRNKGSNLRSTSNLDQNRIQVKVMHNNELKKFSQQYGSISLEDLKYKILCSFKYIQDDDISSSQSSYVSNSNMSSACGHPEPLGGNLYADKRQEQARHSMPFGTSLLEELDGGF